MKPITTASKDRKCAPAIIPELIRPLSTGLFLLMEDSTATVQPCEGFNP